MDNSYHFIENNDITQLKEYLQNNNIQKTKLNKLLNAAIMLDKIECAKLLLLFGADTETLHKHKRTFLHIAVSCGLCDFVELLLNFGANVNAQDIRKLTPLHYASNRYNKDIVKILLKHSADPNILDRDGNNVINGMIEFCIYYYDYDINCEDARECFIHLLNAGVDIHQKNIQKMSAFQVIKECKPDEFNTDILNLFNLYDIPTIKCAAE